MPYNVSFISLGCAKNQVNCEQMMATVQHVGHNVVLSPEGADVAVVNTCGFLASACEEAIDNILEMAELKKRVSSKRSSSPAAWRSATRTMCSMSCLRSTRCSAPAATARSPARSMRSWRPAGCAPATWATFRTACRAARAFCPRRRGMRTCASPRAATTAVPTASFRACAAVTAAAR